MDSQNGNAEDQPTGGEDQSQKNDDSSQQEPKKPHPLRKWIIVAAVIREPVGSTTSRRGPSFRDDAQAARGFREHVRALRP